MHKIAFACLLSLLGTPSFAAQYGLGVELSEFETLYFPIRTGRLIIEPFLAYYDQQETIEIFAGDFEEGVESNAYGIGIFLVSSATESLSIYYGGRIGIREAEEASLLSGTTEIESTLIAPALGLAYSPVPDFSIALEHRVNFLSGEVRHEVGSPFSYENDLDATHSETAVIGRIFF